MSGDLDTLLAQFLRERKYLHNLRPQTIDWYETAWKAFRKSATLYLTDPASLNQSHLDQFIYSLRDRGVRPVTCNTWLRALNAFCRWLHENGHAPTRIHIRPLKVEKRLVETLDVEGIRTIVNFKPPVAVTVNKQHLDGPRQRQVATRQWIVRARWLLRQAGQLDPVG
jgi:site-specific recombinase XerD